MYFPQALNPAHLDDMASTSFSTSRDKERHPSAVKGQAGNAMNVNVVGVVLLYMLVWLERLDSGGSQPSMMSRLL